MIIPVLQEVQPFRVAGHAIHTTFEAEGNLATAKFPDLWDKFQNSKYVRTIPHRFTGSPLVVVYSDYATDGSGTYTVTVGSQVSIFEENKSSPWDTIRILEGTYLVFMNRGTMPDIINEAWDEVNAYFDDEPEYERTWQMDFERYVGTDQVHIYIGVVPPEPA